MFKSYCKTYPKHIDRWQIKKDQVKTKNLFGSFYEVQCVKKDLAALAYEERNSLCICERKSQEIDLHKAFKIHLLHRKLLHTE